MAKLKKTELAAITAGELADGDVFDVVDISDTTMSSIGTNKKITKAELVTAALAPHLADTDDAHDASAISVLDTANNYTGTNVETVLAELPSRYLPWQPNTAYTAGTFLSNGGKLYTVNSNFTTGPTFSTAGLTEAFMPLLTTRKYPAQDFMPSSAAVEGLSYAGVGYWQLDPTTAESVGCRVPAHDLIGWSSATVIVRWFTVTTDTGNISLSVRYRSITDGADVGNGYGVSSAGVILSAAPGAVGIEVVQNMGTVPITANLDLALRVWRQASDAGDLLAANMCFSQLELQRAS